MAVAILDKIYKRNGNGEYDEAAFSLNANTLYVAITQTEGDVAKTSYVSLSAILQNYADFAYNYKGLAVTASEPPTNENVLIWVDDNPDTYDKGILDFEGKPINGGGN